jgi:hypothetical protein
MDLYELYNEKIGAAKPSIKSESTIRQGIQPKLVIAVNMSQNSTQLFIQALDNVLQRLSGFDRVAITTLDSMKDASIIKSMGIPVPGMILIRGKESETFSGTTESAISKFFTANTKLWR